MNSIIRCVIFCGKQNVALRGHTDETGNFRSLLKFRAETDPILEKHLAEAPRNATYISPQIQNELIELCSQQVVKPIFDEVKDAKFYSLLADETSDVSNTEQVSICLRYVTKAKK